MPQSPPHPLPGALGEGREETVLPWDGVLRKLHF